MTDFSRQADDNLNSGFSSYKGKRLSRFEKFLSKYNSAQRFKIAPSKPSRLSHQDMSDFLDRYVDKVIDEEFNGLDEVLRGPLKRELKRELRNPRYMKLLRQFIDILEGLEDDTRDFSDE